LSVPKIIATGSDLWELFETVIGLEQSADDWLIWFILN